MSRCPHRRASRGRSSRLLEWFAVDADVGDRERLERSARAALGVGGEPREAALAEDPRGKVGEGARLAARPEQNPRSRRASKNVVLPTPGV